MRIIKSGHLIHFISIFLTIGSFCCAETKVPQKIKEEIWRHQDDVNRIISYIMEGDGRHGAYNRLASITDNFGHRVTGSQALEDSIDYILDEMRNEGFSNVHGEEFEVPYWVRREERCQLVKPRQVDMPILGSYSSVPTPPEGITADVIVVESFDELEARSNETQGKIVVYNQPYLNYGQSVAYRSSGASRAARVGAVAALVRSVTPFSVNSPHTGVQHYDDDVEKIPTGCITVEDAEMLWRMQSNGLDIAIHLEIESSPEGTTTTRNVVGEYPGSELPHQYVAFGGHIDSWDVGTGTMDDASGCAISWEAMAVMKELGLNPKRTVRTVLWSAEEQGIYGAPVHFERNKDIAPDMSIIMESDMGTFLPRGIGFTGSDEARAIMQEILDMTSALNTTQVGPSGSSADTYDWINAGVPGGNLMNENQNYFIFHHSEGDRMTVEDPHILDLCTALWTSVAYVIADLEDLLPRDEEFVVHNPLV